LDRRQKAVKAGLSLTVKVLSIVSFIGLWHILVTLGLKWPFQFANLPAPAEVMIAWVNLLGSGFYYENILTSSMRVLAGIVLAFFAAVPLGLWIGLSRQASNIIFTNFEIFRPIPLIAYLPIAMLLFPTIEGSIIFITFIGAFFPILINTKDAAQRIPKQLIHAAYNLGCTPVRALFSVYIPAITPEIFTGVAIGTGASWMGVITGEMMSGQTGVGYMTWQAYHLLDYSQSIIGMFTIGLLGFSSAVFIRLAERGIVRWK